MIKYFIISNKYYKTYMSEYYINNIEKFKNYYESNKEKLIKQSLNYYYQNKEAIRNRQNLYFKSYYHKNKDKINESRKRQSNKVKPYKIIKVAERPQSLTVTFP